jgi:hypothetical protein
LTVAISDEAVVFEFQATRPDGCVSLELNATIADISARGIQLQEGQRLKVWEPWEGKPHTAEGTVGWDADWGWGIEIDPETLARFTP